MFKKKLIERAHKTEAILIRFLYKNFIEFFEKKVINKTRNEKMALALSNFTFFNSDFNK